MTVGEEIACALLQDLACREDRKRGRAALESLRRPKNDAIDQLQDHVRSRKLTLRGWPNIPSPRAPPAYGGALHQAGYRTRRLAVDALASWTQLRVRCTERQESLIL